MTVYCGLVYFASPRTIFNGKVCDEDIIAHQESQYRFVARSFARTTHGFLDPTRCGYVVLKDGETLEHVEPILPKPSRPVPGKTAQLGR
jgi:hypothetical protein